MSRAIYYLNKLVILLAITFMTGCATAPQTQSTIGRLPSIDNIKNRIDNINFPIQPTATINIEKFNTCMAQLTSKLKPGLIDLMHSLSNPTNEPENYLFGAIGDIGDENVLGNNHSLHPIIDNIFGKILNDGKLEEIKKNHEIFKNDTKQVTARAKDYLTAYFTKGAAEIVFQTLQDQGEKEKLKDQAASILKRKADDPALAKTFKTLDPQVIKASAKMANSASGFIGRDGTQYGFPGIMHENTSVTIDHSQIGADTIRIILEALRDTYAPLPVLADSTAAKTLAPEYKLNFNDKGEAEVHWHFDHHDQGKTEVFKITAEQFQKIDAHARKAESFVASLVGQAIRGGSWGSLNNEAVAKLVETAAGVVARHKTERVEWCLQAQLDTAKENSLSN